MMVKSHKLATQCIAAALFLMLTCSICVAQSQHRYDFRGAQFPTGRIPAAPGNVRVSGGATFGPVGTAQQLGAPTTSFGSGSSASYSNGRSFVNVGRGYGGAWHHSHQLPIGYGNQFTIVPPFLPSYPGSVAIFDGYTAGVGPHYSIFPAGVLLRRFLTVGIAIRGMVSPLFMVDGQIHCGLRGHSLQAMRTHGA